MTARLQHARVLPDGFVAIVARQLPERRIDPQDQAFAIGDDHAVGRRLHRRRQQPQLFPDLDLVRNVENRHRAAGNVAIGAENGSGAVEDEGARAVEATDLHELSHHGFTAVQHQRPRPILPAARVGPCLPTSASKAA